MTNLSSTFIPQGYYFTIQQAAKFREVSRQTVQYWISQGWISSIQIEGMGHLILAHTVRDFVPPKQGPKQPR